MLNKYGVWLVLIYVLNLTFGSFQTSFVCIETENCEQIETDILPSLEIIENILISKIFVINPKDISKSERTFPEVQIFVQVNDFIIDTPPPDFI